MITMRVELNRRRLRLLVDVCETGLERARGLLLRRPPGPQQALLIPRCHAVHTVGLWYPIDIVFCDAQGTVLGVVPRLPPWRMARFRGASAVWELPAGTAEALPLRVGDRLRVA